MNVLFCSYGNDSVALIQWAHESRLKNVFVVYSDTGWASDDWPKRLKKARRWVRSLGFTPVTVKSEGMRSLVYRKQWPRGGGGKFQFCTAELKIKPALRWLEINDPNSEAVCHVGVRREESTARANWPEYTEDSPNHGGRLLHAPLVRMLEAQRDALVAKTPLPLLPHRSRECYPCVNADQPTLRSLPQHQIDEIKSMERAQGFNSKGNPIVMFSPARCKGAVGIEAVVLWAKKATQEDINQSSCDGGWCGS